MSRFVIKDAVHLLSNLASGLVFYLFALAGPRKQSGFWSKNRNLSAGLILTLTISVIAGALIQVPNFVSVLSALAISHLCRKEFVRIVVASVQDLEALQAKLLKQESTFDNMRNFDNFQIKKTS